MSTVVTIGNATLYLGDCREILPTLGKVDAVCTDPPYGIAVNTDNSRFSGGHRESQAHRKSQAHQRCKKGSADGAPLIGDDQTPDLSPILQLQGEKIIWGWNHFSNQLPAGACLVWLKRNDQAFGSFLSDAEVAWFSKGHGVYCRRDFSNNAIAVTRQHPTQKPVRLMEWCLGFLPDAHTICDPFAGSGSTGVACMNLGRRFIGIEIDERYFQIAVERITAAHAQGRLFA